MGLGIIRMPLLRALVCLDRPVIIIVLFCPLADLQKILVQDDLPVAGAVFNFLVELQNLFIVAVVPADRDLHRMEAEVHELPVEDRRFSDLLAVHKDLGR